MVKGLVTYTGATIANSKIVETAIAKEEKWLCALTVNQKFSDEAEELR